MNRIEIGEIKKEKIGKEEWKPGARPKKVI